jgi:hypothetical protein
VQRLLERLRSGWKDGKATSSCTFPLGVGLPAFALGLSPPYAVAGNPQIASLSSTLRCRFAAAGRPKQNERSDELTWKLTRSVAVTNAFGVLYRSVTPSTSGGADTITASYMEDTSQERELSDLTWLSLVATSFGYKCNKVWFGRSPTSHMAYQYAPRQTSSLIAL